MTLSIGPTRPPRYPPSVPQVRSPALVLRKFEFGDTSQVLHLLTRDHGRVHVLAKGIHRPKSTLGGPLDLLEAGEARWYPRRDGLSVLGGFDRSGHFPGVRRSLPRLEAAFGVIEVLGGAAREEHADPALFDLALATLRALETAPPERAPALLVRFDLRALAALGLAPVLDACVACGAVPAAAPPPRLSPARGGALCGACRDLDALSLPATRGLLASLAVLAGEDDGAAARLALGPRDAVAARRLADGLLRHAFEFELRRGRGR
jgi:DNA repair protein RecO (recombination protein O)